MTTKIIPDEEIVTWHKHREPQARTPPSIQACKNYCDDGKWCDTKGSGHRDPNDVDLMKRVTRLRRCEK